MTNLSSGDKQDATLKYLLELSGTIMEVGQGCWVKITAHAVEPSAAKPHGIDYSLCLFSPDDERLVCFDNAHALTLGNGPSKHKTETNDHVHLGDKAKPYPYENAESLLTDFWDTVYATLEARGAQ